MDPIEKLKASVETINPTELDHEQMQDKIETLLIIMWRDQQGLSHERVWRIKDISRQELKKFVNGCKPFYAVALTVSTCVFQGAGAFSQVVPSACPQAKYGFANLFNKVNTNCLNGRCQPLCCPPLCDLTNDQINGMSKNLQTILKTGSQFSGATKSIFDQRDQGTQYERKTASDTELANVTQAAQKEKEDSNNAENMRQTVKRNREKNDDQKSALAR